MIKKNLVFTRNIKKSHTFCVISFFRRMKRIEQIELLIENQRKQNNQLDCQIAALKVNIDDRNLAKDYLINEKDIIARNER